LPEATACPTLSWTTLGTAGGPVPDATRAEPSNLLRAGDRFILVDTGDGTVNQLARIGMNVGQVDTVFISHHHHDHTGGLAAVIGLRWMAQYPGLLTIYGPPGTAEMVDGIVASLQPQARVGFGTGASVTPPADIVRVIELGDGAVVDLGPLTIRTAANSHFDIDGRNPYVGALSLSYRFDYDSRSITYSGDTGPSVALQQLATESDLLVTEIMDFEAIFEGALRVRPDMTEAMAAQFRQHMTTHHLTAEEVGLLAQSADVDQVLLTHYAIAPGLLSRSADYFRQGIRQRYDGPLQLGRDLETLDVGCR